MFKKTLLAATLCIAMLAGSQAAPAQQAQAPQEAPATVEEVLPEGQELLSTDAVNSTEVDGVEVSATAKKMTQAEKARNAAENDKYGGAITIIAMCIVLFALIVLSLLFLVFGKISEAVLHKKKRDAKGLSKEEAPKDLLASGETIAAIATALAEHFNQDHDLEDAILTIRKMKRAYSPWNSKIYNMREVPELKRNVRR